MWAALIAKVLSKLPKGTNGHTRLSVPQTFALSLASGALEVSWALFLLALYKAATSGSNKAVGAILVAIGAAAALVWYLTC